MCVSTNVHELVQTLPKRLGPVTVVNALDPQSDHWLDCFLLLGCPFLGTPSYNFDFRSSVQKKRSSCGGGGRGEDTRVWYRETMFSKVVTYDFPLPEYPPPPPPHRNPELRCSKRFDHRSHLISFVIVRV